MRIINESVYRTSDLRIFCTHAVNAMGCQHDKLIVFLNSGVGRTTGCAEVGPSPQGGREADKMVIEIASPGRLRIPHLAKILQHELLHTMGVTHARMTRAEYWSLGPCPEWARTLKVRTK